MKIKTSELEDLALDWAVARCEFPNANTKDIEVWVQPLPCDDLEDLSFQPSTYWALGGPIIEREGLGVQRDDLGIWFASYDLSEDCAVGATGSTPLVAAMRCYVASKLGNEVDVPDELMEYEDPNDYVRMGWVDSRGRP